MQMWFPSSCSWLFAVKMWFSSETTPTCASSRTADVSRAGHQVIKNQKRDTPQETRDGHFFCFGPWSELLHSNSAQQKIKRRRLAHVGPGGRQPHVLALHEPLGDVHELGASVPTLRPVPRPKARAQNRRCASACVFVEVGSPKRGGLPVGTPLSTPKKGCPQRRGMCYFQVPVWVKGKPKEHRHRAISFLKWPVRVYP